MQQKDGTFLDILYAQIKERKGLNDKDLSLLKEWISNQQYDTDAIEFDTNISDIENNKYSNILNLCGEVVFDCIKECISENTIVSQSFSNGFIFKYWKHYKNAAKQDEAKESQDIWNTNDFSGYSLKDLYVKSRHNDFKQEIMQYSSDEITFQNYENLVIGKSLRYVHTDKVRGIKSKEYYDRLHYGINKGSVITQYHLMCIILYCDFSVLSTNFSGTFRRIFPSESLKSVKKRNQKYWYLSKGLMETVQYFGTAGDDTYYDNETGEWIKTGEYGPFYCGMSCLMLMPGFNLRLCAPNSSSKVINIAMRFCGDNKQGMIMQINNIKGGLSGKQERFMDVSWISRYCEEEERIMMGGRFQLQIETIINMETKENYKKLFKSLYFFESIINGSSHGVDEVDFSKQSNMFIQLLIDNELGLIEQNLSLKTFKKIPDYIIKTFKNFCSQKRLIIINFDYLFNPNWYNNNKYLWSLIMYSIECDQELDDDGEIIQQKDIELSSLTSDLQALCKRNLVKLNVFSIFKNLHQIIIYCGNKDILGYRSYSFSLSSFIHLIKECNSKRNTTRKIKYCIKDRHLGSRNGWISSLYSSLKIGCETSFLLRKKEDTLHFAL
eukprot:537973_1